MTDVQIFLKNWLRAPRHVGAVLPSSANLARVMAQQVNPNDSGQILELGPGTGVVTKALLHHGIDSSRLILIERDRQFCSLLQKRFPEVTVLQGDARRLGQLLDEQSANNLAAVVSGLPFRSLSFALQRAVLRESFRHLLVGQGFIQFTYGLSSPIHPILLKRLKLTAHPVGRVLRNLPPATVWRYQLAD